MERRQLATVVLIILLMAEVAVVSASAPDDGGARSSGVPELVQVVPVWQQVNSNGFGNPQTGEVSALAAFSGYLYAGTYNSVDGAQIFRSPDGVTWAAVTQPGFGISHDIAPFAILDLTVFNGRLYASTGRRNASQLWRTLNGVTWAPMDVTGFSDPDNVDLTALAEYGGMIYAGVTNQVTGAQIWRSFTGDNNTWTKVAPDVPGTVPASVTGFAEFAFDGGLYAAVELEEGPAQIWRSYGGTWEIVVNDGFGDANTVLTGGIAEYLGDLYAGAGNTAVGAQLWHSTDGDIWTQAITPGFGDSNNQQVESVYVFQNQLYVSVKNAVTGMEIWQSADGTTWEQVNLDGFGDSNNTGTNRSNATAEFLGHLYVGTANVVDGGELWSTPEYAADLSIAKVDDPDSVNTGAVLTYTLTITNAGPDPATTVTVTDTLPVEVTYGGASGAGWNCGHAGGEVTCTRSSLGTGVAPAIVITVTAPGSGGVITNSAGVASATTDPNPANNHDTEQTTVVPPGAALADLSVAKLDTPDPVNVGAVLTYTLTITNSGPDPATTVMVTDDLPVEVTYGGASGAGWNCGHAGGEVTCTRPSLAIGVAPSIVVTVTAPSTNGTITNTVTVSAQETDPHPGNNSAQATTRVNRVYTVYLPSVRK